MRLEYFKNTFVFRCDYHNRLIAKNAGFKWNPNAKVWYTKDLGVATRLREYADSNAENIFKQTCLTYTPKPGGLSFDPKGPTPYPFQLSSAQFALERNKSYLGLEPGLGKTGISALLFYNEKCPGIYICPPFLTRTVEEELNKWLGFSLIVGRYSFPMKGTLPDILIIPDSLLTRDNTLQMIYSFQNLTKKKARLIVDEAHRYKNHKAQRTKVLFDTIVPQFSKVTFLSGTPMPNRPMELYPVLSNCAPETIDYMSYFDYGMKYCAGFKSEYAWDFTGASNLLELSDRIVGKFLIRIRKQDVLKELPPKIEDQVIISDDIPPSIAKLDKKLLEKMSPDKATLGGEHVATYRRLLGNAKVDSVIDFVKHILEDTEESILIFAWHTEVIEKLQHELNVKHVITGQTPMKERHETVAQFQKDKERIMLGNILAMGTGFTLTKATRVIFAEFSWVPGDNDQASDRAHRIGQRDSVLCQYLVYKNSFDRNVLESNLAKKKNIEKLNRRNECPN